MARPRMDSRAGIRGVRPALDCASAGPRPPLAERVLGALGEVLQGEELLAHHDEVAPDEEGGGEAGQGAGAEGEGELRKEPRLARPGRREEVAHGDGGEGARREAARPQREVSLRLEGDE